MRKEARFAKLAALVVSTLLIMTVLDLLWLGVVARSFYDSALGPLKRPTVLWSAAALFYCFYVTLIVRLAVLPAIDIKASASRGALLGLVAYGTYELTNWAVLAGWPAVLVPVDVAWGVCLTATCGALGRALWQRLR